jgi:hypothetical protein
VVGADFGTSSLQNDFSEPQSRIAKRKKEGKEMRTLMNHVVTRLFVLAVTLGFAPSGSNQSESPLTNDVSSGWLLNYNSASELPNRSDDDISNPVRI